MKYKGLITGVQPPIVKPQLPRWQYGEILYGKKIIDSYLQFGCFMLGYENDEIVDFVADTIKNNKPEIAESLNPKFPSIRLNHISFDFADRLHAMTDMKPIFSLSGSDANEGAVKLASAYHYQKGNHHKKTIVGFENSYHGSTWLTMSIGHDRYMQQPFYTLDPYHAVKKIPRDFSEDCLDWSTVAAVVVETCMYPIDMVPPSKEFWDKLDRIRSEHDVLIIIDDIFMGGGKTGNYVGWKDFAIKPDIATMAKSITGGFFPLSMVLYSKNVGDALPRNFRWDHGFTYSFSLAGIASAMKYLDILERDNLLANQKQLVKTAESVINESNFDIIHNFGLNFTIQNHRETLFYVIPLNATDEYFSVLKDNLR